MALPVYSSAREHGSEQKQNVCVCLPSEPGLFPVAVESLNSTRGNRLWPDLYLAQVYLWR